MSDHLPSQPNLGKRSLVVFYLQLARIQHVHGKNVAKYKQPWHFASNDYSDFIECEPARPERDDQFDRGLHLLFRRRDVVDCRRRRRAKSVFVCLLCLKCLQVKEENTE